MLRRHALACPLVGGAGEVDRWSPGRLRFLRQQRKPHVNRGRLLRKQHWKKKINNERRPSRTWIFKCIRNVFIYWEATEFQQWCLGTEFQEMIFQLVYHGSAVTRHPLSQVLSSAEATQRGVTQSPSSRFSGGGKKKKMWRKLWPSYMLSTGGYAEGEGSSFGAPSTSRLGLTWSYREVNYTWLRRVSKTWANG